MDTRDHNEYEMVLKKLKEFRRPRTAPEDASKLEKQNLPARERGDFFDQLEIMNVSGFYIEIAGNL